MPLPFVFTAVGMIVTVTAGSGMQCCGGLGVEAAESVSSIDIVSAPGLSVWSLVSAEVHFRLFLLRPQVSLYYNHHQ